VIDDIKRESNQRMGKSTKRSRMLSAHSPGRQPRNPRRHSGAVIRRRYAAQPGRVDQRRDARTPITPWDELLSEIEKAILKSDLGITPASNADSIRIPLPPLSEENRRDLARQAKQEAEQARVAVRNIRRDAISDVRDLLKEKEISEDDARRAEEDIQRLTDKRISEIDHALSEKESDLLKI
jgi:ribosome recycling factor